MRKDCVSQAFARVDQRVAGNDGNAAAGITPLRQISPPAAEGFSVAGLDDAFKTPGIDQEIIKRGLFNFASARR